MRLRVVLFGTGSPLSLAALSAAARAALVVGIVAPSAPALTGLRAAGRRLARWRSARPLRRLAHQLGVDVVPADAALEEQLRRMRPDLLCVASFPRLLRPELFDSASLGALGLHPSLLPRHRGPDPLYWTYVDDDREAGVTLHWLDAGEDSGDLVHHDPIALARGRPVTDLYAELAQRGAALLERALGEIPAGRAPRVRQDPARATREGAPDLSACPIDWATWSPERVCHVLNGLGRWYPLLTAPSGRPLLVSHARPVDARGQADAPGTMTPFGAGLRVSCRQGAVELSPRSSSAGPLQWLRGARA
jgi:methionyl-tRNA formyltransferase